jgi:hypothetical protein
MDGVCRPSGKLRLYLSQLSLNMPLLRQFFCKERLSFAHVQRTVYSALRHGRTDKHGLRIRRSFFLHSNERESGVSICLGTAVPPQQSYPTRAFHDNGNVYCHSWTRVMAVPHTLLIFAFLYCRHNSSFTQQNR